MTRKIRFRKLWQFLISLRCEDVKIFTRTYSRLTELAGHRPQPDLGDQFVKTRSRQVDGKRALLTSANAAGQILADARTLYLE